MVNARKIIVVSKCFPQPLFTSYFTECLYVHNSLPLGRFLGIAISENITLLDCVKNCALQAFRFLKAETSQKMYPLKSLFKSMTGNPYISVTVNYDLY